MKLGLCGMCSQVLVLRIQLWFSVSERPINSKAALLLSFCIDFFFTSNAIHWMANVDPIHLEQKEKGAKALITLNFFLRLAMG